MGGIIATMRLDELLHTSFLLQPIYILCIACEQIPLVFKQFDEVMSWCWLIVPN
jgi:hypothetical protein